MAGGTFEAMNKVRPVLILIFKVSILEYGRRSELLHYQFK